MPAISSHEQQDFLPEAPAATRAGVSVMIPLPLGGAYDYALPSELSLCPGDIVRVPLGPRSVIGVVWDRDDADGGSKSAKLKTVFERLDVPPLPEISRRFVDWVANYVMAPPGVVLRMALGPSKMMEPVAPKRAYRATGAVPERMTPARRRVLDLLAGGPPRTAADIMEASGVGRGVVTGLASSGALGEVALSGGEAVVGALDPNANPPRLSEGQERAAASLVKAVQAGGYTTALLEGVTGAGKTEVYCEAIAAALEADEDAQILVMMPEIALTEHMLHRFEARFGARPTAWHSDLGTAARRGAWQAIAKGKARIVIGARSGLFLPFPNLKLIIVDEEHDPAYKQEDRVIYQARDMAVVRAFLGKIPAILVSATPSIESVVNCWEGRYTHVSLPQRHGGASIPKTATIDMRRDPPARGSWLSPVLVEAVAETLKAGEQALLFLNRRGYAPAAICRACGHRLQREGCSASLVVHDYGGRLQCHYCSYSIPMPEECPECGATESIVACGPGVERLADEARALFPDARIGLMSSDTISSPAEGRRFIAQVVDHELDLVIGTQLVTKGHHFPMLTLVGVVDADLGLSGGDLRAAERTYQQLWQVAGRAGRAERPGRVFLQSYAPDHPVMQALASGSGPQFYENEAAARREQTMPPYGRLVALILSGESERAVEAAAQRLARVAPHSGDVAVLGPAPAPFARLRGQYRYRLLLKTAKGINVQKLVLEWLARAPLKGGVRVAIDVDPYSFL